MSKKRPRLEAVRIVRAKAGGPLRTIVASVRGVPTGFFVSRKARRALPWEARAERLFLWICEAQWDVRTFMAQALRMDFHMSDGTVLSYIVDVEIHLSDGGVEIVEVKKTQREMVRDPYYAFKIWLARQVCAVRGWKFRVVTLEDDLGPGHLLENASAIRMNRWTSLESEDFLRLAEVGRLHGDRLTWAGAVAALSRTDDPWSPTGVARLHAMIVRRHVRVDIERRIRPDTAVILTEQTSSK
jgi:hypothetical protein